MNFSFTKTMLLLSQICFNSIASSVIDDFLSVQNKNPAMLNQNNYSSLGLIYSNQKWDTSQTAQFSFQNSNTLYTASCFTHRLKWLNEGNSYSHHLFFSYALNPWKRLSTGVNIGFDYAKYHTFSEHNLILDIGLMYQLLNSPVFGEYSVGAAAENLLSPSIHAKIWNHKPLNTKVSFLTNILGRRVQAGLDVYLLNCLADSLDFTFNSYLGFNRYPFNLNLLAGDDLAGGSIAYSVTSRNMHEFSLSMLYTQKIEDRTHRLIAIKCSANLENSREEKFNRRMACCPCFIPNELYVRGVNLYNDGKYFDALIILHQIIKDMPEFFKNDWCSYFVGDSYFRSGFLSSAKRYLNSVKDVYKGAANDFIILSLLKIALEENATSEIAEYTDMLYSSIRNNDSLLQEIHFLNADYQYIKGNFAYALNEYKKISFKHVRYNAAQYSAAAIYVEQGNRSEADSILSELQKQGNKNGLVSMEEFDSIKPLTSEEYYRILEKITVEYVNIQNDYDSLGYALESLLQKKQSASVIRSFDSLQSIIDKSYKIIEAKRLVCEPLIKKWQTLGVDLLRRLNKNELKTICRFQKILIEAN